MFRKTSVNFIGQPDLSKERWCRDALCFHVVNGKGTLENIYVPIDDDGTCQSHLRLNGMPIIQGQFPGCPTCSGLLATGYGIEKIDCPELEEIRGVLNRSYPGIKKSYEAILPLLGLLTDGYYLLAEADLIPTDGEHFFYNVSNMLTVVEATSDWIMRESNHGEGFPAYMYPTQSSSSIKEEHVEEYVERIRNGEEVHGLAYAYGGSICALLDGHHKAIASAKLHKKLPCLIIIPCNWIQFPNAKIEPPLKNIRLHFHGITFDLDEAQEKESKIQQPKRFGRPVDLFYPEQVSARSGKKKVAIEEYPLTDDRYRKEDMFLSLPYCSIFELDAEFIDSKYTDEQIREKIQYPNSRTESEVGFYLLQLHHKDPAAACDLAKTIVKKKSPGLPYEHVWRILLCHIDKEVIDLATSYYIDHDGGLRDRAFEIAEYIMMLDL